MATEVKLPRLGQGMESGVIVKWLKSEGDPVEKGDVLYELETEKVTQEVEAEASGVLLKIAVAEGEASVGTTVAVIGEQGEEAAADGAPQKEAADGAPQKEAADEEPEEEGSAAARDEERERGRAASAAASEQPPQVAKAADGRADGRVKASPLARRIARERGIDLAAVKGTGPEGRVVAEDVERAAATPAPGVTVPIGEVEVVELSAMRRTIARRMTEAWQIPVFHLFVSADVSRALEARAGLVELYPELRPTISDLLTKICAAALMRHRELNASFGDDGIALHPSAHVGIAVAVPEGLIVPVIHGCERKSVAEIAEVRADVVARARDGKLQRSDIEGGTFTISNLGMFGVERFTAVINPPQAAILAVGAALDKPVVVDGQVVSRPMMDLMLTCDHRTVNGATGAEFLGTVKKLLEEPALAL